PQMNADARGWDGRTPGMDGADRAYTLIHTVTSMFAGALALGIAVPLFITAQRQADAGRLRARMTAMGREIAAQFREDVRAAGAVEVTGGGSALRLTLPRVSGGSPDVAHYFWTHAALRRELRRGGRPAV